MSHNFPPCSPQGGKISQLNPNHLLYRQNYTRWIYVKLITSGSNLDVAGYGFPLQLRLLYRQNYTRWDITFEDRAVQNNLGITSDPSHTIVVCHHIHKTCLCLLLDQSETISVLIHNPTCPIIVTGTIHPAHKSIIKLDSLLLTRPYYVSLIIIRNVVSLTLFSPQSSSMTDWDLKILWSGAAMDQPCSQAPPPIFEVRWTQGGRENDARGRGQYSNMYE